MDEKIRLSPVHSTFEFYDYGCFTGVGSSDGGIRCSCGEKFYFDCGHRGPAF